MPVGLEGYHKLGGGNHGLEVKGPPYTSSGWEVAIMV